MPRHFQLLDDNSWPNDRGLWEITDIQFGLKTNWQLWVDLYCEERSARMIFSDPISFRVQDEREMSAYWSSREKEGVGIGTRYIIGESDYLDEFRREVSGVIGGAVHYLICGVDSCLEVLSRTPPDAAVKV